MRARTLDDPTLAFLRTVWALDHRLQTHSKRMKSDRGVTGPQRFVLRVLEMAPGTSPTELARVLCFHKSTVTVILRGLEQAGLVRREPNDADGRSVVLTLTAEGRAAVQKRAGTVEARFRATLSRLPMRDVVSAQRVLDALADALD